MRDNEEVAISLYKEVSDTRALNTIACDVVCYRGKEKSPRWMDLEPGAQLTHKQGVAEMT